MFCMYLCLVANNPLKLLGAMKKESLLPPDDIIRYTHGILSGLMYIHNSKIIHRDLRSPNILLSSSDVPKLADFGISKQLDILNSKASFSTVQGKFISNFLLKSIIWVFWVTVGGRINTC